MCIKGRAANIRSIENFLHSDRVVVLLQGQRNQCFVERFTRAPNAPVWFVHSVLPPIRHKSEQIVPNGTKLGGLFLSSSRLDLTLVTEHLSINRLMFRVKT